MASMQDLPQTLRSVAASKARQVERQRARFEGGKQTLQHCLDVEPQGAKRLKVILDVYKDSPMMLQTNDSTKTFIVNLERFMLLAVQDPSARVSDWEKQLMSILEAQSLQYDYCALYAKIMEEWMDSSEEPEIPDDADKSTLETEDLTSSMEEHRKQWESYVFTAVQTDQMAVTAWLDRLLRSPGSTAKAFDTFKREIVGFEKAMTDDKEHFTKATMNWCVDGLLRSDLLSDDKRAVLSAMQQDRDAMVDVTDDLNVRMNTLDRWTWPVKGVPLELRRQVGSKYRIFHDEDIMDALLLRYIGVKWSVQMCKSLTAFSKATWLSAASPIGEEERLRRERHLGVGKEHASGVDGQRLDTYLSDYFLTQLLKNEWEVDRGYDNGVEQEDAGKDLKIRKTAAEQKHSLLQLLVTEATVTKRLHNEVTVLQSDFQAFGPSLPHSTIMAVLTFFGVSNPWIQFFRKVLEVPIMLK
ncbi:MAG: hypothetical protein L6R39_005875 [Caloplaca ligustica]|nr:MAG: hypothetical protein L6R39_005875 [Caloplaca ligustica]